MWLTTLSLGYIGVGFGLIEFQGSEGTTDLWLNLSLQTCDLISIVLKGKFP